MLFNSYAFSLVFLPLALLVFGLLARHFPRSFTLGWLLLASIVFYAWSSASALLILAVSVALNYGSGRLIERMRERGDLRTGLVTGITVALNLLILAQCKYLEFFAESAAALFGVALPLTRAVPPLAISFFTFQQIAYLIDVQRGNAAERSAMRYGLFVCFFPQLIAGPIVHHKDMLPQFERGRLALKPRNVAIGLTLFVIGLSKKVVIADGIVEWVAPVFAAASQATLAVGDAWAGTLAYTLQLYFDFSGYCDMAIGLGLMFGIRLPINFDSPYQATSVVDFWRRWHMTLSRFLRDYLYFGLGGNRRGRPRRYINLMLTMLLGGLWHGANWTFVVWGLLHGLYLVANHAWRALFGLLGRDLPSGPLYIAACRLVTLLAVMVAWVFFRADSLSTALEVLSVMVGFGGTSTFALAAVHGEAALVLFEPTKIAVLLALLVVVSFAPNSQQIIGYTGIEDDRAHDRSPAPSMWLTAPALRFQPSLRWAALTASLLLISLVGMSEAREFVYFRF